MKVRTTAPTTQNAAKKVETYFRERQVYERFALLKLDLALFMNFFAVFSMVADCRGA